MTIHERYRNVGGPALAGLAEAQARLEAAEQRRAAETAQQVAAAQVLVHDPEVRLAMGPEEEAQAYEHLNDLEASIGLPPTLYVDVPQQEFAKQVYAGQVQAAAHALPASAREALLDTMADAIITRFGPERVARYMVDLRNQQALAQQAENQGKALPAPAEPLVDASRWVRGLLEAHAPPAVEEAAAPGAQSAPAGEAATPAAAARKPAPAPPSAVGAKAHSAPRPTAPPARAPAPPVQPGGRPARRPAGGQPRAPSLTDPLEPNVERWRHLVEQYFPVDQVKNALHVMQGESHGHPQEVGDTHPIKGVLAPSYGLLQIRDLEGRWREEGYPSHEAFLRAIQDPKENIRIAAHIYHRYGWAPWTAAQNLGLAPRPHRRPRRHGRR